MMNRLPVQRCQYCGCEDIGLGCSMARRWSPSESMDYSATGCSI